VSDATGGPSLGLASPRSIVQLEGAALTLLGVYLFARGVDAGHWSWWLFAALILAPDLAILAFLIDKRLGAIAYNIVHAYVWPAALAAYGIVAEVHVPIGISLIWATHISIDRALGFGLKYPTDFKDTHIQRL
jgi:hypothetical protein